MNGQRNTPAALPPRKTRYPLYNGYRVFSGVDGPQRRSGEEWKISPLPGFDPRTVQPVASRYTDYAISAPTVVRSQSKIEANKFEDFFRPRRLSLYRTGCRTYEYSSLCRFGIWTTPKISGRISICS
jgi:hypothetical protein